MTTYFKWMKQTPRYSPYRLGQSKSYWPSENLKTSCRQFKKRLPGVSNRDLCLPPCPLCPPPSWRRRPSTHLWGSAADIICKLLPEIEMIFSSQVEEASVQAHTGTSDPVETMAALRGEKDNFKPPGKWRWNTMMWNYDLVNLIQRKLNNLSQGEIWSITQFFLVSGW